MEQGCIERIAIDPFWRSKDLSMEELRLCCLRPVADACGGRHARQSSSGALLCAPNHDVRVKSSFRTWDSIDQWSRAGNLPWQKLDGFSKIGIKTFGNRVFGEIPVGSYEGAFMFLCPQSLREAVLVCREWNEVIRLEPVLRRRLKEFVAESNGGGGVLYFLAGGAKSGVLYRHPCGQWYTTMRAVCSSHGGGKREDIVRLGVGNFWTQPFPYSWVGVELHGGYSIIPRGYRLGTSTVPNSQRPTAWEFQASCAYPNQTLEEANWGALPWVVLDTRTDLLQTFKDAKIADFQLEADRARQEQRYCRFRVVQTGMNVHWGHAFVASGLDVYGLLIKS